MDGSGGGGHMLARVFTEAQNTVAKGTAGGFEANCGRCRQFASQRGCLVTELVLSLFPGIGLLDRGFEDAPEGVTHQAAPCLTPPRLFALMATSV